MEAAWRNLGGFVESREPTESRQGTDTGKIHMGEIAVNWPKINSTNSLKRDDNLLALAAWYANRGFVPHGYDGQRIVFEAAEHALCAKAGNPPGLFVWRVRDWHVMNAKYPISEGVCDKARVRLKTALGMIDPARYDRDPLEEAHM